ncbi:MAG: PhzF family phenazine biosynthesis protein [Alphaproteobacteria bacterium]|nr:MAG: PhzF family phenazine biosynthesis protein [Alphaproteobacteria bacterium]
MELTFYQIDAFADRAFTGNPAAVCLIDAWLDEDLMQNIAMENNLAETAYLVREAGKGAGHYNLRWFTPGTEVDLCGHATLASAHALWVHHGEAASTLTFHTRSGPLVVSRGADELIVMDFPSTPVRLAEDQTLGQSMLNMPVDEVYVAKTNPFLVLGSEEDVLAVQYGDINFRAAENIGLNEALIITAPAREGSGRDCVSRFFAPYAGIPEDPVTGSAHTSIVPYWANRLGKADITAYQASPRGGTLYCTYADDRVILRGTCADYCRAVITL